MSYELFSKEEAVVGILFMVNGVIFYLRKPRPGKERQMRVLSFGLFFAGVAMLLRHWMLPDV